MIPLSVEAKLITIVVLALLNLLLLKRKRNDDSVESYLVDGQGYNVNDRDQESASFGGKQKEGEKVTNVKEGKSEGGSGQLLDDAKESEKVLFVRFPKDIHPQKHVQKPFERKHENQHFYQINANNPVDTKDIQQLDIPPLPNVTQIAQTNNFSQPSINQSILQTQVTVPPLLLPIPMQQQLHSQEFHDIFDETKSDKNPKPSELPNKRTTPLFLERKYFETKFPFEPQSESDSKTKKTEINLRLKEKNQSKNHCQCCKQSQAPRQTLKRCLQDLIYTTFQEMIEKNSVQQTFGNKKKKRSL